MNDQPENEPDEERESFEEPPKPTPMGRNFYIVMALIAFLVFLILFINIPGMKASVPTTLSQTNWTVHSYSDSSGTLVSVTNGSILTARFDSAGNITGSSGCNVYSAAYTVKDDSLSITSPATTDTYCFSPGIMDTESAYLTDLVNSTIIRIRSNDVYFYDAEGKARIIFNPSVT